MKFSILLKMSFVLMTLALSFNVQADEKALTLDVHRADASSFLYRLYWLLAKAKPH